MIIKVDDIAPDHRALTWFCQRCKEKEISMTALKVLIVEDSPTALYVTGQTLADDGHRVLRATDGKEAVRIAVEEQPDLILLDVILPGLNGFQVCREIKTTPETAQIPVILLTSKTRESDRKWGLEQGADGYLMKPYEASDLLEMVSHFAAPSSGG